MRILHTADWHLGKRLEGFSRIEEQKEVLREICEIAESEQVDVVLIAGDLFDNFNPPTEATELFYKTIKRLACNGKRPVVAIAGNHDSPDRIEAPDPLARECGIIFVGYPHSVIHPFSLECNLHVTRSDAGFIELQLPDSEIPLRLLLTPYANEFRLKTYLGDGDPEQVMRELLASCWQNLADIYCDDKGVNLLMAHLYMMKKDGPAPEEPDDERPIVHIGGAQAVYSENVPAQIQYVAMGHLHRQQVVDNQPCPIVYSSSPLAYSFSEANQTKYVMLVEVEPSQAASHRAIPLSKGKKLLRQRFEGIEEAVDWLEMNPNVLVELTIATDTYLTATERKQLYAAHDGIVTLIPEVFNQNAPSSKLSNIDLSKGIEELFTDFFKFKHTQEPNDRLINLFREALASEDDE
ncbi:MAG: exonuclease subunit SbcD [Bacteroidota bacterium]